MSRRSIFSLVLLAVIICGIVIRSTLFPSSPTKPITSQTDGVYYSAEGEWSEFYANRAPPGTGWVHLPRPCDRPAFASGVDPFLLGFVQPHVCGECHPDKYEGFEKTSHFRTSSAATLETVLGDFTSGKHRLDTKDPNLYFEMTAEEDGLFQRVVVKQPEGQQYEHRERFDIVTGSGNHGQTYLYWAGDQLCQLPISYFTESGGWINSPGHHRDGTADFARGIGERCLACHTTYFATDPLSFNRHDPTNYILGVTCVRCHGPGWAHVQYHRTHETDVEARYIVNPGDLPQDRANEVCAQCHSGVGELLQPAFSYRPGEPLDQFLALDMSTANPKNDDPHAANQLLRLMKSRCFKESKEMTCGTCHDPHQNERGNLKLFAERCVACHEEEACHLASEYGSRIRHWCVECHMPSRRDAQGAMETTSGVLTPLLRDHFIRGWPDATERVIGEMQDDPHLK